MFVFYLCVLMYLSHLRVAFSDVNVRVGELKWIQERAEERSWRWQKETILSRSYIAKWTEKGGEGEAGVADGEVKLREDFCFYLR